MKRIVYLFALCALFGCKKSFLDVVPNKSLLIPATTADMQALLDNTAVFTIVPGAATIADGDYMAADAAMKTWSLDAERNSYSWAPEIWESFSPSDWKVPNQQVFYTNVVLDGLPAIPVHDAAFNQVKGTALFCRAFAWYQLLQEFAPAYRAATAGTEPGLSIRLTADVNQRPPRSSLQATYDRLTADLLAARQLLPVTGNYKSRPTVAAAFGLLARVYLVTGDYARAGRYADSCLQLSAALIDYNTLSTTATKPFPRAIPNGNDEVIYYASDVSFSFEGAPATLADTTLYRSYAANDLRRAILFTPSGASGTFKGNYSGILSVFAGIATDELYLVRAECAARQGQTAAALTDLNTVLARRWKTGTFVAFTAPDADAALRLIIAERRKELFGRALRWSDLKRLNSDPRFAVTLSRVTNGVTYTLAPDSRRYAYPLPADEIALGGAVQNDRP